MADLIAYQDGNWTGATTWKGVVTSSGAKQTGTSVSSSTTTSYVYSPAFTVTNSAVIEGVLLHCNRSTTTGTISISLSDDNGTTATREVTVNAADLPVSASWVFFKFATTLTGDGGTDYKIGIKGSSSGNGNFYRSGTIADWARYLRTNSIVTIGGVSDVTFICDELTGAAAKTDITVIMDQGEAAGLPPGEYGAYGEVNVGHGGVFSYATSASMNYQLELSGNLNIWGGGTFNMGTSTTPMPSTSTAILFFTMGTNVLYGLEARSGSTVNIYGATKDNTKTLLTADAASGQAVINVTSTSGWAANDVVALASTTRTASESEKRTVSTINSGTQATLSTNLSATHHGTGLYVGEVVNLTRNVKIRGTSQSLCAYVNCAATSSFTASYAEFYFLGSGTTSKRGIDSATTSAGTFSMSFCSIYDLQTTASVGIFTQGSTGSPSIEDCVMFSTTSGAPVAIRPTSGTPSFQRNYIVATVSNFEGTDLGGTIKDNRFGGCGVAFQEAGATIGTIKDNVQHSTSSGITIADCAGTFDGFTVWRNTTGIAANGSGYTIANSSSYHNVQNVAFSPTQGSSWTGTVVAFTNCSFNGGSGASLTQTTNQFSWSGHAHIVFDSCSFGTTQTVTTFGTWTSFLRAGEILFRKCTIADTVTITNQSNLLATQEFTSAIKFDKFNNTSGSHRTYKRYGRTESDQTTFKTAAPSEALIPNTSGQKLPSGSKKFAGASGTTATVTVYVNKSATYNGNQPRLIVKANSIAGIASDTVLATASGGTGSWLTLSGTTASVADNCVLECYVDCDGTAGTVYVDDWSVS